MAIRWKFGSQELQVDAPVAGDRAYARLLKGKSNRWLCITVEADLAITVAVSAVLGVGSILQCIDAWGIDEGGKDPGVDPRFFIALTEALSKSTRTKTRVTSLSASPVHLVEQVDIPFEYLEGGKPGETRWREMDLAADTRFFYILNATNSGIAKLVSGGTAALTNFKVTVTQEWDNDVNAAPPLFRPAWIQKRIPVVGTNPDLQFAIGLKDICQGMTILQNTSGKGMVTDIINKFSLKGDSQDFIGRGSQRIWANFARGKEREFGGDVYAGPLGGIVHQNFRQSGRISNCLNPGQDSTITLSFDCQLSVTAGAVTSEILVLFHLLQRKGVQRAVDGMWVTSPVLPKDLVA